ncbi:MAG: hypothetical protein NC133_01110 [Prevotella sp.]|nr:hypothetical protein [Prevotella sp.]
MVNPASCQFANYRSVRFNLDNFALPVVVTKKKNTIYTNYLVGLKGTKHQLLSLGEPVPTYGYDHVAEWNTYIFASNNEGLYYANRYRLQFEPLNEAVYPKQLLVAFNRLLMISENQKRIFYSVAMDGTWGNGTFMDNAIYVPDNYGLCLEMRHYQGKVLLICEEGLLTINRHLVLEHLADDSEMLKANRVSSNQCLWESDWFSLGYATDTQTLREIFLKTNVSLTLTVTSNRTQRNIPITGANQVQKIKINLNGDQFKLALSMSNTSDLAVSDFAAVVTYGKRG